MAMQTSANRDIQLLYEMARELRLDEFHTRSQQLLPQLSGGDLGELLCMRAQLKLLCSDASFAQDLSEAAALLPAGPVCRPLLDSLVFQDPNSFIAFGRQAGSVAAFLAALREAHPVLCSLCTEAGAAMGRQIESEILYFMGDFEGAMEIAVPLHRRYLEADRYDRATMAAYTLLRCYLATREARKFEDILTGIVTWAKREPMSLDGSMYRTIRTWVNLTTGWGGDTVRYHVTPSYEVFPVLEDRTEAMLNGIADLGPTETPFVRYAELNNPSVVTMRRFYADIYKMMLLFREGDREGALKQFEGLYAALAGNRMFMPFAEYGGQIVPLLFYARRQQPGQMDNAVMDALFTAAQRYEEGLVEYRGQ